MWDEFMYVGLFFFFKQKTAYEMRISDWSSDVCSSDLRLADRAVDLADDDAAVFPGVAGGGDVIDAQLGAQPAALLRRPVVRVGLGGGVVRIKQLAQLGARVVRAAGRAGDVGAAEYHATAAQRSEEHTSELQSLMRISYAVFCLKKKT